MPALYGLSTTPPVHTHAQPTMGSLAWYIGGFRRLLILFVISLCPHGAASATPKHRLSQQSNRSYPYMPQTSLTPPLPLASLPSCCLPRLFLGCILFASLTLCRCNQFLPILSSADALSGTFSPMRASPCPQAIHQSWIEVQTLYVSMILC
jgi:hypothetical protein